MKIGNTNIYIRSFNQWRFCVEDIDIVRLSFTTYLPCSFEIQVALIGIEVFFGFDRDTKGGGE